MPKKRTNKTPRIEVYLRPGTRHVVTLREVIGEDAKRRIYRRSKLTNSRPNKK